MSFTNIKVNYRDKQAAILSLYCKSLHLKRKIITLKWDPSSHVGNIYRSLSGLSSKWIFPPQWIHCERMVTSYSSNTFGCDLLYAVLLTPVGTYKNGRCFGDEMVFASKPMAWHGTTLYHTGLNEYQAMHYFSLCVCDWLWQHKIVRNGVNGKNTVIDKWIVFQFK